MSRILRLQAAVIAVLLVFGLSGCTALQKKFTPKTKAKPKEEIFSRVRKYDIKPSSELYEKHYIFWTNWYKELTGELGDNYKSDKRAMQEMLGNMEDMASMLVDEKSDLLMKHVDELKKAKSILDKRDMTTLSEMRIRRTVEKEYRLIKREFSPKKMAGFIREDWK